MEKRRWKQILSVLLRLIILGIILWFVFRNHYKEIYFQMIEMNPLDLFFILCLGSSYQIIGGIAFYYLAKQNESSFSIRQSIASSYIGLFGTVVAFSFGSIPMRTYYLHTKKIDSGKALGLINTDYMLHKCSVLFCNTLLLCTAGIYFLRKHQELLPYIVFSYVICFGIILALFLIGFSSHIYEWMLRLVELIPEQKKWTQRKQRILQQLEIMRSSAEELKKSRKQLWKITLLHCIKLMMIYALPYVCLKSIGGYEITFLQMQMLTALTNLISSALPNVSGLGSIELAFLIVFSSYMNKATVSSILILYRLATYFFPFFISVIVVHKLSRRTALQHG